MDITPGVADYILLTGDEYRYAALMPQLRERGIPEERILADRTVFIPGFTFEKYRQLKNSRLSIVSPYCSGGILYNLLCLPFRSPCINMRWDFEEQYMSFLEGDLREELKTPLKFLRQEWQDFLNAYSPVYELHGVEVHMNHYPDRERAERLWYERIQRINWYNMFFLMFTERQDILERFDRLPYGKKVCFTPLESDLPSAWHIPPEPLKIDKLWRVVNLMAYGVYFFYDLWDMLLYGKRTPYPQAIIGCNSIFAEGFVDE